MRSLINDHVMLPRGVGMSTRGGNTCPSCRPPAWQRETQHISSALTPRPPFSSRSRRPGDGEDTWDYERIELYVLLPRINPVQLRAFGKHRL